MKKIFILLVFLLGAVLLALSLQNGSSEVLETPVSSASSIEQNSEVRSLDGDKKLVMTLKENADSGVQYSFSIPTSGKDLIIFTKTLGKGETMALHHNSWSPNNKYVLIEDRFGTSFDYLVFKTNGEDFANGQKYLNATALFNEKVKNYKLEAITGWDDPVLLHVLTSKGPPFWFDLTTQSFIQLAR